MPKRVKGWDDRKWLVPVPKPRPDTQQTTLRLSGTVPPEVWNRLGNKMLPKLRSGADLSVGIKFSVSVSSQFAQNMETDLQQILNDLGLGRPGPCRKIRD